MKQKNRLMTLMVRDKSKWGTGKHMQSPITTKVDQGRRRRSDNLPNNSRKTGTGTGGEPKDEKQNRFY